MYVHVGLMLNRGEGRGEDTHPAPPHPAPNNNRANYSNLVCPEDPTTRFCLPNLTPRHYHIIVHREKGSLFIYAMLIARILLLIAVLDFPAAVKGESETITQSNGA